MEKMFIDSLVKLYDRDLQKLETEIGLYNNSTALWAIKGEIKNSGGNLCLHLCGNLQHYIGHVLGNINYVRNREHEFAAKGIAHDALLEEIRKTRAAVIKALQNINAAVLEQEYPAEVWGYPITTMFFLIHLQGHLNYHLGQINYHRRLMMA